MNLIRLGLTLILLFGFTSSSSQASCDLFTAKTHSSLQLLLAKRLVLPSNEWGLNYLKEYLSQGGESTFKYFVFRDQGQLHLLAFSYHGQHRYFYSKILRLNPGAEFVASSFLSFRTEWRDTQTLQIETLILSGYADVATTVSVAQLREFLVSEFRKVFSQHIDEKTSINLDSLQ